MTTKTFSDFDSIPEGTAFRWNPHGTLGMPCVKLAGRRYCYEDSERTYEVTGPARRVYPMPARAQSTPAAAAYVATLDAQVL